MSGMKNVYWRSDTQTWRVTKTLDGKDIQFGTYACLAEAARVARIVNEKVKEHGNAWR